MLRFSTSTLRRFLAKTGGIAKGVWSTVRWTVLISLATLLTFSAYSLLVWTVLRSEMGWALVSVISLSLGLANFGLLLICWVFVLSKHFSTHSVKVMDMASVIGQKKSMPVDPLSAPKRKTNEATYGGEADNEEVGEEKLDNWARNVANSMMKPVKEKLTDNFS